MHAPPEGPPLFADVPTPDPVQRIRTVAARIRQIRGSISSDGLTPAATRSLLDELTTGLEACARALEAVQPPEGKP